MNKNSFAVNCAVALTMIAGIAFLLALGSWQLDRLAWKEGLIALAEQRAQETAEKFDTAQAANAPEALHYKNVTVTGRFETEKEAYLYTIVSEPKGGTGGPGWFVITPFVLEDGSRVLVNRGFVPVALMPDKKAWAVQETEPLTLKGIVTLSEPRGLFAAQDNQQTREFYTRDSKAIAAVLGVKAPEMIIDRAAEGAPSLPQAGETLLDFNNNHLAYAFTWFALAGTLTGFFLLWIGTKMKSKRDKRQENR